MDELSDVEQKLVEKAWAKHKEVKMLKEVASQHRAMAQARQRKIPRAQRRRVLARDEKRCVVCWRPYQLQLHHFWDGTGEYNPYMNTLDDDLVTLCASCHGKIETIWSKECPFYLIVKAYMKQVRQGK